MKMDHNHETDALRFDRKVTSTSSAKAEWGKLLVLVGIASTFGAAVPVGYNIGVINAPYEYIRSWCNHTVIETYGLHLSFDQLQTLWSTVISMFLVGGCIGSLAGAWFADKFGRKGALLTCGFLFAGGAFLFYVCRGLVSVECLLLGRLFVGLASGLATSTVPMYMAECAPLELRGTFAVLTSMGVTGGVVVGQVASLQMIWGNDAQWHIALSAFVILVLVCFAPFCWFPESPKFLYIVRGRRDLAKEELRRLRGSNDEALIHDELTTMECEAATQSETRSIWSVISDSKLLLPVVLVVVLQGGQQLSGVNAVFYYSTQIFQSAGLSLSSAQWANLGAGCLNLFIACFSPMLMQRFNRRPIILGSCFISGVFLLLLTIVVTYIDAVSWFPYGCVAAVLGFISAYQTGLGPIPFFIGSELFEIGSRPAAMAIGSLASWACNFLVGMSFLGLRTALGALVFLPFSLVCFGMVALLYRYLPETRGKQPSEIAPLVADGFRSRSRDRGRAYGIANAQSTQ